LTYGLTGRNDGDTYQAGANYGTTLGKTDSYINLSLQLSHRGKPQERKIMILIFSGIILRMHLPMILLLQEQQMMRRSKKKD
ncbi:hypothetical protein, partial [Chryseobacterium sp. CH1]|uniref:hypothetical protein n=1 Tax=Chryseobacterium sp. CH1 TaxID=713551 RepID=UPI001024CB0C